MFCFENSRGGCPFLARARERERERESLLPKAMKNRREVLLSFWSAFRAAIGKNVVVKTRNRRAWFLVETLVPVFFISLMVVPSHLIEEKTVKSQFFISRPLANIAWGLTRGFESMDGGKYRIAYSPSGDEEARKVAKKAALRLVCENQPNTFGAIVSVNAKYTLKSNSPIDAIPNLIEDVNNLTRSSARATTTVDVLRDAIPKTFSEREDGKDVPFLACDDESAEALLFPVSSARRAEVLAMDPENKILIVVNLNMDDGTDIRYEIRANQTSGIASGKTIMSGASSAPNKDRNSPFMHPFQKWVNGVDYEWTKYYAYANVQSAFNRALFDYFAEKEGIQNDATNLTSIQIKASAFPEHDTNIAATISSAFFSLSFVFAFAVPLSSIAKSTAYESVNNLRLHQELLGCSKSMYWSSWFLAHYAPLLVVSSIISLVGKQGAFVSVDASIIFGFFVIWSAQLVAFGLFVSSSVGYLLNKLAREDKTSKSNDSPSTASVASLVSVFAYVVTWVPGVTATMKHPDGSTRWLYACFFSPASALHVFGEIVSACERHGSSLSWKTFADDDMYQGVTVRGVYLVAFANWTAFTILLLMFFIRGGRRNVRSKYVPMTNSATNNDENEEDAIRAMNVTKRILQNVNFRAKKSSVCALLGQNGAGKTTLVSVLAGLESSTNDQTKIETSGEVGFCPQFDFLWPQLTVREHLRGRLVFSGSRSQKAKRDDDDNGDDDVDTSSESTLIQTLASKLAISNKLDEQVSTLSGGQKRKVSLLLSLLNSSIAILDEPTASMDPVSKRSAWKLIAKFTKTEGNSVVLATHHMDEVEALADDLVVLHNGRSVIESISVEEMKRLRGGSKSEPSLEDAFFNFIASEKAKEEQEEEEDDDIVVSLQEVDSVAIEHNEDAKEEKTTKMKRVLRQVHALWRARYLVWKRQPLLALFGVVGCAIFFTLGLSLAKSGLSSNSTSTLHSNEYAEEMTASTFLGESKPLFATSISRLSRRQVSLPMSFYASVRTTPRSVSKQYECQRNSFLLPVCRNVSACSEKFGCTSENNIKSTIDYEMMKQAEFTATRSCGSRKSPSPCAFYYLDATTNTMTIAASPTAYHAIPTALSLIDESMFASAFREKGLTLTAINSPLPLSKSESASSHAFSQRSLFSMFVAMCAVLGLSIASAILTPPLVRERTLGFKHALLCAGLTNKVYWLATATFDFVSKTFPALLLSFILCQALREDKVDVSSVRYGETLVFASIAFAFQATPIAYLSSLLFSDDVSSFATQAAASFSVAVLSLIAAIVLDGLALAGEDVSAVWNIVSILFCASPQYGFARLFYNLSRREHAIARFEENNEGDAGEDEDVGFSIVLPDTKSFLEWENSGRELLLMFVFGFFYWFVFIILEWRAAKRIENAFEKDTREDECNNDGALTVMKLKKQYRKDRAPSVDSISFTVSAKEAFALCGINGAGKTTSFAMLSGLLPKTNGRVLWASANKSFGYCAQTNGVEDFLAPVEHLDLFASVVASTKTSSHASSSSSFSSSAWCERFQSLQKHKTVLAKNLSGGAKRELCVAIALSVAEAAKQTQSHHPSLILLDEPTAGVDPFAKRKLWEAVEDVMKSNRGAAVVITSHDVFECEKVCASVGLLREGKFLLCGNTSDIKKEFSKDACSLSSLEDVFIAVVEREDALRSTD